MNIGDIVTFEHNGVTVQGTIVNVYVVPKDYNLVDIETEEGTVYGISTELLTKVEP